MNDTPEILLLRKQLLQARSRLDRLRLRRDARALREKLRIPRLAMTALSSAPAGLALLGLGMANAPRNPLQNGLKLLVHAVQVAGIAVRLFSPRQPANQQADSVRQRTDRAVGDA